MGGGGGDLSPRRSSGRPHDAKSTSPIGPYREMMASGVSSLIVVEKERVEGRRVVSMGGRSARISASSRYEEEVEIEGPLAGVLSSINVLEPLVAWTGRGRLRTLEKMTDSDALRGGCRASGSSLSYSVKG